jgi:hypothetical protein
VISEQPTIRPSAGRGHARRAGAPRRTASPRCVHTGRGHTHGPSRGCRMAGRQLRVGEDTPQPHTAGWVASVAGRRRAVRTGPGVALADSGTAQGQRARQGCARPKASVQAHGQRQRVSATC